MIKYYRTMDHQIHEISEPMEGTWISLIHRSGRRLYFIYRRRSDNRREKGKRILPDDSMWYHPDRESDHYGLSGRYSSFSRL